MEGNSNRRFAHVHQRSAKRPIGEHRPIADGRFDDRSAEGERAADRGVNLRTGRSDSLAEPEL